MRTNSGNDGRRSFALRGDDALVVAEEYAHALAEALHAVLTVPLETVQVALAEREDDVAAAFKVPPAMNRTVLRWLISGLSST